MLYLACVMFSCSHINVSYFVNQRWILTVGSPPLNAVDDEDNPILITSKMAQIRNRTTILLLSTWWLNRSKKLRQFKGHTYYYYWHPLFHLIGSKYQNSVQIFLGHLLQLHILFCTPLNIWDLFLVDIHKITLRFAIRRFAWGAWGDLMVNNWKYTYRRWWCSIFRLGWRQRAILENRSLQMWMTMIEACQIFLRHMFHLKWRWSDKHSNFHWIWENLIELLEVIGRFSDCKLILCCSIWESPIIFWTFRYKVSSTTSNHRWCCRRRGH